MGHKLLSYLLITFITVQFGQAAPSNNVYDSYAKKNAPLAQDQMKKIQDPGQYHPGSGLVGIRSRSWTLGYGS